MDLKSLIPFVERAAPLLATYLSNPALGVAGTVVKLISDAFGTQDSEELKLKLANNEDAELKLKTVEEENKVQLLQIASKNLEIAAHDRESARQLVSPCLPFFIKFIVTLMLVLVGLIIGDVIVVYINSDANLDHKLLAALPLLIALLIEGMKMLFKFILGG